MRRILIHPGFHKTGTTSAQAFLNTNRKVINRHYAILGPSRLRQAGLINAARAFTGSGLSEDAAAFTAKTQDILNATHFGARRGLILTDENLAGRRPGGDFSGAYQRLPEIMGHLVQTLRAHFAPDPCEITIYLSTRALAPWATSLWGHNVRKSRVIEDGPFEGTTECLVSPIVPNIDLDACAAALRAALPDVVHVTRALEDVTDTPFGPGTPFADWLCAGPGDFAVMVPGPRTGVSPPMATTQACLELNRTIEDDLVLRMAKQDLLDGSDD